MSENWHSEWLVLNYASACESDNPSFHWIISVRVISGMGKKWNRPDSFDSDSDSVELMTPLTTPIFTRLEARGGGGVLPYMGYIDMCGPKGYGFSAVLVINRVSIIAILPPLWS